MRSRMFSACADVVKIAARAAKAMVDTRRVYFMVFRSPPRNRTSVTFAGSLETSSLGDTKNNAAAWLRKDSQSPSFLEILCGVALHEEMMIPDPSHHDF
jgi:hypothetical protein